MALSNYGELKTAIADWLERDDLTSTIPDFITLAESLFNQALRDPGMAHSDTVTVGLGGEADLPSDWLETIYLTNSATKKYTVELANPGEIMRLRRFRLKNTGEPVFHTVVGRRLIVAPPPASETTLQIRYYRQIPAHTGDLTANWLLTDAPHLYLFGALRMAAPYLHDAARDQIMNATLTQMLAEASQGETKLTVSQAAPLAMGALNG